jgi:hypothetical protein
VPQSTRSGILKQKLSRVADTSILSESGHSAPNWREFRVPNPTVCGTPNFDGKPVGRLKNLPGRFQ